MTKRHRPPEPPELTDGYWWFRNWIALKTGGYHHAWRIARIDGDKVLVFGHAKPMSRTNRYFHRAIWGPVILPPPVEDEGELTSALAKIGNRQNRKKRQGEGPTSEKVLAVARRITMAFVASSDDLRSMYADAPDRLEEVDRQLAGLIEKARGEP